MMELLGIIGGQVLRAMVGTFFPHIPDIPSNVLGVDFLPVRKLVSLRDYLRG